MNAYEQELYDQQLARDKSNAIKRRMLAYREYMTPAQIAVLEHSDSRGFYVWSLGAYVCGDFEVVISDDIMCG